ncbi:MAG TPA: ABC transporter ATP-binding protein, partial [Burkholderiaceae bacterium]
GAGKTTLMNILYGYYQADTGEIRVDGKAARIDTSQEAIRLGIGMVHQHFMLVEDFTVLENIVLGAETSVTLKPSLQEARTHLAEMAAEYDMRVDPDARIENIGVGEQQRVEVLKALYRGASVLILDEPTAVLTPDETDHLFRILQALKAQGKTILLITHKLREILEYTDYVTVMRGGAVVGTVATKDTDAARLAEMMVGRSMQALAPKVAKPRAQTVLEVRGLNVKGANGASLLADVDLDIHAGEIVGIAGVAGNGQSELLEVLAGMRHADGGSVTLNGKRIDNIRVLQPNSALFRDLGISHVPEDRLRDGLVKSFSCMENAVLGSQCQPGVTKGGLLSLQALRERTNKYIQQFDIRPNAPDLRVGLLSGGNQQKLVMGREIDRNATLYLIGQPTRGVDIGAIELIHQALLALREQGKAILLVSVELDEIMALSDRIVVMCGGRVTGTVDADKTTQTELGLLMGGKAA